MQQRKHLSNEYYTRRSSLAIIRFHITARKAYVNTIDQSIKKILARLDRCPSYSYYILSLLFTFSTNRDKRYLSIVSMLVGHHIYHTLTTPTPYEIPDYGRKQRCHVQIRTFYSLSVPFSAIFRLAHVELSSKAILKHRTCEEIRCVLESVLSATYLDTRTLQEGFGQEIYHSRIQMKVPRSNETVPSPDRTIIRKEPSATVYCGHIASLLS
jgi:hypothetical protein